MTARSALLLLLLPVLAAAAPDSAPPAVTVTQASAGTLAETILVTGTLVAREEVLVSPQIDQLAITSIAVEEGDRVAAGQVLATLSHDALDASLAQNAAQQARADAAIAQAQNSIAEAQASRTQADAAYARAK